MALLVEGVRRLRLCKIHTLAVAENLHVDKCMRDVKVNFEPDCMQLGDDWCVFVNGLSLDKLLFAAGPILALSQRMRVHSMYVMIASFGSCAMIPPNMRTTVFGLHAAGNC